MYVGVQNRRQLRTRAATVVTTVLFCLYIYDGKQTSYGL
ncbi:unnamed protein product [Linum tenue]|uniref:Uncharacterized protein n=1 Tax=Linum tenue TaxID=586396 RepID=A0AAV0GXQ6_9ROSI|nr:unnamed protein product [Linum tenue]